MQLFRHLSFSWASFNSVIAPLAAVPSSFYKQRNQPQTCSERLPWTKPETPEAGRDSTKLSDLCPRALLVTLEVKRARKEGELIPAIIHSFIPSFNTYLLNPYFVLDRFMHWKHNLESNKPNSQPFWRICSKAETDIR